jgi:hypothetical protein
LGPGERRTVSPGARRTAVATEELPGASRLQLRATTGSPIGHRVWSEPLSSDHIRAGAAQARPFRTDPAAQAAPSTVAAADLGLPVLRDQGRTRLTDKETP